MHNPSKQDKSVGRPRSEAAKTAIIQATISLLDTVPFSNLTIEAIAKQSGVSKATIYRWWPNKEALLFTAFLHVTTVDVNFEPALSIADNFRQVIGDLVVILNQPLGRALITVLIDQPERVTAFQTTFFEVKRRAAKQLLTAGQAQHVIKPDIDLDKALDMLFGAVYLRVFLYTEVVDTDYIDAVIAAFMQGIRQD
ncbi:hypothetical protein A9176_01040 [Leuconostoc garlicum]|uniref:HTH tetR-type domain-containing protein n=1 Tax=Leuconostoc garlicum TaxID=255248 RepID=A0ABN4WLK3_9LACO|nr:TetR/AcrR family transcriptional regulator [Leuconostoc garlicum]AQN79071.1 hypothetical protein A9176_01040 [Leuconostoc garlicum]